MTSFTLEIEGIVYESKDGIVSLAGPTRGRPAVPRNRVCFSGVCFEVSSLPHPDFRLGDHNTSLFSICIPFSVISIPNSFFSRSARLSFVAFEYGSQLSSIDDFAFENCGLRSICIPSGVEILGTRCFMGCRQLSSVVFEFGSRLSLIQNSAFWNCSNLKSICLPARLERLHSAALLWRHLTYLGIEAGNESFSISGNYLVNCNGTSIIGYVGQANEVCIGEDIEELCDSCFFGQSALTAVVFEGDSQVRRIGTREFVSMWSLKSIVVPASVESIGDACFSYSGQLSSISFGQNSQLSAIGADVFRNCTSLKTIWIPSALKRLLLHTLEGRPDVELRIHETGSIVPRAP
jgi:hypothetical protein